MKWNGHMCRRRWWLEILSSTKSLCFTFPPPLPRQTCMFRFQWKGSSCKCHTYTSCLPTYPNVTYVRTTREEGWVLSILFIPFPYSQQYYTHIIMLASIAIILLLIFWWFFDLIFFLSIHHHHPPLLAISTIIINFNKIILVVVIVSPLFPLLQRAIVMHHHIILRFQQR